MRGEIRLIGTLVSLATDYALRADEKLPLDCTRSGYQQGHGGQDSEKAPRKAFGGIEGLLSWQSDLHQSLHHMQTAKETGRVYRLSMMDPYRKAMLSGTSWSSSPLPPR